MSAWWEGHTRGAGENNGPNDSLLSMAAPHGVAARTGSSPQRGFSHAVVAGASMAGLLAARVLSEHFDRVTLIERDRLPGRPEPGKGVPQGQHVHVLLPRDLAILESLFRNLTGELFSAGAMKVNAGRDLASYYAGGWCTRHECALDLLAAAARRSNQMWWHASVGLPNR